MALKLTAKQAGRLLWIREFIETHGYAPTLAEMRDAWGLRCVHGPYLLLVALERKGWIKRTPGAHRAIQVIA